MVRCNKPKAFRVSRQPCHTKHDTRVVSETGRAMSRISCWNLKRRKTGVGEEIKKNLIKTFDAAASGVHTILFAVLPTRLLTGCYRREGAS